ncbi:MAG: putative protein YxaL [Phycisphaerae bacterium]|nr:putative protein YxaL [Phycisphaerae bacterium]
MLPTFCLFLISVAQVGPDKAPLRAEAAQASRDWPSFRGDARLTGVSAGRLPERLSLRWTFRAPEAITSTAAIVDGVVYVGCDDGALYALSLADGAVRWTYATSNAIRSSPAVHRGVVYFGNDDGELHAVDAARGEKRWMYKTDGEIISSVNVGSSNTSGAKDGEPSAGRDALLFFGSYDDHLYALRVADGSLAWKYQTAGRVHGTPSVVGDRVLVAGCDELLHVVASADGKVVRTVSLGSMSGASAAAADGRAYAGTYGNQVVAVDVGAGRTVWTFEDQERPFPFLSSAAVTDKAVIVGGRDKRVRALSIADGKPLWEVVTGGRVDGSPVVCGTRVYVGSGDGNVYALDVGSGREVWRYESGAGVSASPAIGGNRLVIGNEDGTLLCFGEAAAAREGAGKE